MRYVIIGCGGIGSHLIPQILRYAKSSPGQVVLVDGDHVSLSNLDRQDFEESDIGACKSLALHGRYKALYDIDFVDEYVGVDNVAEIIEDGDVVLLCVDNHVCRKVVSQHCESLENITFISGGNELTDGNVICYLKRGGTEIGPRFGVRHPEILTTEDGDRSTMSCEEIEALPGGEQIIATNVMVASWMLTFLHHVSTNSHKYFEVYFDLPTMAARGIANE